ncbi:aromatic ring-hydroxylating dioxygenase subunit alpha [Rhodococcus rhodnii]|uniref:Rieske-type oxygenase n=2 Tax=Rhodococcus rhodnii TaxID=38312 RepID=R7WI55_9NOCA|nr:Rieske 2Fe-2S domain-containing protein [Rhodococcus rhodnii]EOM74853.1 dioxygenase Rieske iron-sulfur component [Rhodococcus rhodnii LMG 5362]TXG90976.1 aromatic ring-hydroxylating dioxygenase subunit alpha [Rhodococcus rhodnii]
MTTQLDRVETRDIDAGTNPTRFARGWHCLGLAASFRDGRPHQIDVFGTSLVVFADTAGALHVLDAFCRHMGGNLAHGEIKGDAIACPFHDWRWSGNGRCEAIPYARRTPKLARTKSWLTMERNGLLFVWNCPQGSTPPANVTVPEIDGYEDGQWSDWTWTTIRVDGSHCREIVDNVVDMAHFFYVHYQMPEFFKNVFEGHVAAQYMRSYGRDDIKTGVQMDLPEAQTVSDALYYGPSFMLDTIQTVAEGTTIESKLVNCHYPVTSDSFVLQFGTIVKKVDVMSDEQAREMATLFTDGLEEQFHQDIEIWKHKSRIENPLLTEEDGPVYQLRRWYSQFYVDLDDVTPDMTARYEFEVDTTRALESWHREVDENIAAAR